MKNTVLKGLKFVVIDLEDRDDSQIIFETLNARGTPLLQSDLVKNFLFHQAEKEKLSVNALYGKYWKHFDENNKFWRNEIKQGRLFRPAIDIYLFHYLTLKLGVEVVTGRLFSEFKNYEKQNIVNSSEGHLESLCKYANIYSSFYNFPPESREGIFF